MLSIQNIALCFIVLSLGHSPCAIGQSSSNNTVRMNQIQVIGTHNSYHAGIARVRQSSCRLKTQSGTRRSNTGIVRSTSSCLQASARLNWTYTPIPRGAGTLIPRGQNMLLRQVCRRTRSSIRKD